MIFIVRHAHAGSRSDWHGRDDERPLSSRGFLQAKQLAERLVAEGAARVISSPYLRCVQTVEPIASLAGIAVETDDGLAEGAGGHHALALIEDTTDGTVLCSHGDVLHDLVWMLARRGVPVDLRQAFQKAAVLRLDRSDGTITGARYEPPPSV